MISGTSGSDSPGQAVEAEEIVKQLDMEQVDEITTSTTTSTNGAAYSNQAVQVRPSINNGLEEAEETVNRDIPPLTGEENVLSYVSSRIAYKNTIHFFLNMQIKCISFSSLKLRKLKLEIKLSPQNLVILKLNF